MGSARFEYREAWRSIGALYALAAFGFAAGVYQVCFGYPDAPPLAGPVAGIPLIGLGVFFLGLAVWTTLDRRLRRRAVEVSQSAIALPRSRWSASHATVPLDEITSIRTSEALLNVRLLEVTSLEGRYVVRSSMLPRAEDFEGLLDLLAERAGKDRLEDAAGVGADGKRRVRPQFSLAGLFVLVTLVAVILGSHRYVYGEYAWGELLDVGFALAVLLVGLRLAHAGRWRIRAFSRGFVVGYFFEVLAVYGWLLLGWVRFAPGSGTPGNWYPLTFPLRRLAERLPEAVQPLAASQSTMLGGVVSGLAWGSAAVAVGWMAARARSRGRRQGPAEK